MKAEEARRQRRVREREEEARRKRLQVQLSDRPQDQPAPDMVPTVEDRTATLKEYRRLARLAAGEMRGSEKHRGYLDRVVVELARLIYVERVLAMDSLARAALTPARLVALSSVSRADVFDRFERLQRADEPEVVSPWD